METIRLRKKIQSETLHLPELKRLLGKEVEIILMELPSAKYARPRGIMDNFISAAGKINIDAEAVAQLREDSKL